MAKLKVGMTKGQVRSIMGKSDGMEKIEIWSYETGTTFLSDPLRLILTPVVIHNEFLVGIGENQVIKILDDIKDKRKIRPK